MIAVADIVWVAIITVVGGIITAVIGTTVNISLKKREGKVDEALRAFEQRGMLVDAQQERLDFLESETRRIKEDCATQISELKEKIQWMTEQR